MTTSQNREHAVVIGAGMAGLLAAHVLTGHFRKVTLVDRDRFPDQPGFRKGVPQSRHTHLLLGLGLTSMERLLPGIRAEFTAGGAVPLKFPTDACWLSPVGWYERFDNGMSFVSARRSATPLRSPRCTASGSRRAWWREGNGPRSSAAAARKDVPAG
jgi:choline dehydrogenase-like flavoprotein